VSPNFSLTGNFRTALTFSQLLRRKKIGHIKLERCIGALYQRGFTLKNNNLEETNMSNDVTRRHTPFIKLVLMLVLLLSSGTTGSFLNASTDGDAKLSIKTSFAPVIKKVAPSVVTVWSSRKVKTESAPFLQDPFFRRFFNDDRFGSPAPQERREQGLGSGVIVSEDGYILTNNHVVDGGTDIKVTLSDKRELTAKVIGTDSKTDLAVLKVDQRGLAPIKLGDSSKVEVGDIAIAMGNPFGVGQTVTMGIISATGRGGLGIEEYEDFLQTDAAINPGNSGGALINADGELIGINTAILSRSGGNQGVGFAIPANMARNVMDQLIQHGKVSRAFLGVSIQPVTPQIAKAFGLAKTQGALVSDVADNSPAERVGLKAGDVILSVDGTEVVDSRSLQLAIGQMTPGRTAHLKVWRDGSERDFSVSLGDQSRDGKTADASPERSNENVLDGVATETLTPEIARQLNINAATKGVFVRRVDPGSAAAQAGLERGDVILEVNRHPVSTVEQLNRYIGESTDSALLFVHHDGRTRYVVVSLK
jgi:serine protease Do